MFISRILLSSLLLVLTTGRLIAAGYDGLLIINVSEETTGEPLAVRMQLRKSGRPVRIRAQDAISVDGSLVFDGSVTLELKQGNYEFAIDAGPEFQTRQGHFSIERHADDETDVTLTRRVSMRSEGWWAGDLDVAQKFGNMPLLMRAAGIDFAPVTVAENDNGKCRELRQVAQDESSEFSPPLFGPWAAIENRAEGGLVYIGKKSLPEVCSNKNDSVVLVDDPSVMNVAINAESWLLPVWAISGKLNAVEILGRQSLVDKANAGNVGYPRDKKFFPGSIGPGRWSEAIYHHLLNCGFQLPPAAGSGSGRNGNPVGTNRVYAYCSEVCTVDGWLQALAEGKVMVTNGPLLRTKVEGQLPGHVFELAVGEEKEFQISLSLMFYEKAAVEYLELLKNGEPVHQIRLKDLAAKQGQLSPIRFAESGWFAVRAMTSNSNNYQYATTGPYYVVRDGQPRVSRRSVEFFLDWLVAAKKEFAENELVLKDLSQAESQWKELLAKVNAD